MDGEGLTAVAAPTGVEQTFAFYRDDTYVARATVRERDRSPLVEDLHVDAAYRRQGVGSRVLDDLAAYYAPDYDELWVHALAHARPFYAKNGFETEESDFLSYFMRRDL